MFNRLILGSVFFFCTTFQTAFTHTTDINYLEKKETHQVRFSLDPEKIFFEKGALFFESTYNGTLSLPSVNYLNGEWHADLPFETIATKRFICRICDNLILLEDHEPLTFCSGCGNFDWALL